MQQDAECHRPPGTPAGAAAAALETGLETGQPNAARVSPAPPNPGQHRLFRYRIDSQSSDGLDTEGQRALALFYALNMARDGAAMDALLRWAGEAPQLKNGSVHVSRAACVGLAAALRAAGYPLDDEGIRRFKLERGFPPTARLGAEIAAAYGRFARGVEARLNITNEDWQSLDEESRRALQILLLIGRSPTEISAVRRALGVRNAAEVARGPILVGTVTAKRLVSWAHSHGMALTESGLQQIAEALKPAGQVMHTLATFITDAVLCRNEPRHDYTRLRIQDHTLNKRTVTMLNNAAALLTPSPSFTVTRGSYDTECCRGAHPHLGGGVVDLALPNSSDEALQHAIVALRRVGFAAWVRWRGRGAPHVHAIAIGDREMAPAALWQVSAFFSGRDGRTRSGPDPHARLACRLPMWTVKYRIPNHRCGKVIEPHRMGFSLRTGADSPDVPES